MAANQAPNAASYDHRYLHVSFGQSRNALKHYYDFPGLLHRYRRVCIVSNALNKAADNGKVAAVESADEHVESGARTTK